MNDRSPFANQKNSKLKIKNVYEDNFQEEISILSECIKKYNYVGMDTEFPGTLYSANLLTSYQAIRQNVNSLKLIQVGITIADKFGNLPENCGVWQFNLKFSLKYDKHAKDSINMLLESGLDFNELETRGIPHEKFAECILSSGLVLNEDIKWICFHGVYDFAYLLRIISNLPLPETEEAFFYDLKLYFPVFYDIRYLIRFNDNLKGSLNRLAQELNVKRQGKQHQAGSDSLVTLEVYIKLIQEDYINESEITSEKNCLFGLSPEEPEANRFPNFNDNFGISNNDNYMFQKQQRFQPEFQSDNSVYNYNYYTLNNNLGNAQYGYNMGNDNARYFPYMQYKAVNTFTRGSSEDLKRLLEKKGQNRNEEE